MKVMTIGGIRPDWINLEPVIKELDKWLGGDHIVVHTGQHYDYNMDKIFFDELKIRDPDYFCEVGSGTLSYQRGETIIKVGEFINKFEPDLVIGFSDANPVLGCIAAATRGIKIMHIESGMRSNDARMPEEYNRRMIDHISDILFCPTEIAESNLLHEDISQHKIFRASKLIIDVLTKFDKEIDERKRDVLYKFGLSKGKYFLSTEHRPENVEDKKNMANILEAFNIITAIYDIPLLFVAHPRTQAAIKKFKLTLPKKVKMIDYIGFLDFSALEKNCFMGITDSGTVEEDLCWFRKPCVTTRISTERPETEFVGANIVSGLDAKDIVKCVEMMNERKTDWHIPYYEGTTKRIVAILKEKEDEIMQPKKWW